MIAPRYAKLLNRVEKLEQRAKPVAGDRTALWRQSQ